MSSFRARLLILLPLTFLLLLMAETPVHSSAAKSLAQPLVQGTPLTVSLQADSLRIEWQIPVSGAREVTAANSEAIAATLQRLPSAPYEGYVLPLRTIPVYLPANVGEAPSVLIEHLHTAAWPSGMGNALADFVTQPAQAAPPALHQTLENADDLRALWAVAPALPPAPVFLLRQGRVRGQMIAVYAVSPIYSDAGETKLATSFNAVIPTGQDQVVQGNTLPATTVDSFDAPFSPESRFLINRAARIVVHQAGVQRITGEILVAAGIRTDLADQLRLFHQDDEIALEVRDDNRNNQLDPSDEVRFYAGDVFAEKVGDQWNPSSVYWIGVADKPGLRMSVADARPNGAPQRSSAVERGVWQSNEHFFSFAPGPDGDYFFSADMRTLDATASVEQDASAPSQIAALNVQLPLTTEYFTSTFTLHGTSLPIRRDYPQHTLRVQVGQVNKDVEWKADTRTAADWSHEITATVASRPPELKVSLLPGQQPSHLLLDRVEWSQPVHLDFAQQGGAFSGVPGSWVYMLTNTPAGRTLYDVTDAGRPVALDIPDGLDTQFQAEPAVRDYLLAGAGTLHAPSVQKHAPAELLNIRAADAVYIAPPELIPSLQPLVEHRRRQGYEVAVINVQEIYALWNDGYTSPTAIREFLRFAVATWRPAPISAVLVGDGTWDPLNHLRKNNVNFIPPYMADVDRYIHTTACENCYFQLDGADPLVSDSDPNFLIDLWGGRFPVKSVEELDVVVDKIIDYETDSGSLSLWRSDAIFVADDYEHCDGTRDGAGDFAAHNELIIEQLPPQVDVKRAYYEPTKDCSPQGRERLAREVHERTLALANAGAGLFTFSGHGLQWGIAQLGLDTEPTFLLGLYDADLLTNRDKLFVALQMTCLTSQFARPAVSGTTVDERLFLNANGGAVAVWGSSGLSVAAGHDVLQIGFHRKLWQAEGASARLGELVEAGYLELFTSPTGNCCLDQPKTFLLLGDPLTPLRITLPESVTYLPMVTEQSR